MKRGSSMISGWGIGPFTLDAFEDRWIPWSEIVAVAHPGRGNRIRAGDPRLALALALKHAGVYAVAHATSPRLTRKSPHPADPRVVYIGESGLLRRRLIQFGTSAGLYGKPDNGHSAGWRWWDRRWPSGTAYFALYPLPPGVAEARLGPFWRLCREAQAQAAYAQAHRERLPELNAKGANDSQDDE